MHRTNPASLTLQWNKELTRDLTSEQQIKALDILMEHQAKLENELKQCKSSKPKTTAQPGMQTTQRTVVKNLPQLEDIIRELAQVVYEEALQIYVQSLPKNTELKRASSPKPVKLQQPGMQITQRTITGLPSLEELLLPRDSLPKPVVVTAAKPVVVTAAPEKANYTTLKNIPLTTPAHLMLCDSTTIKTTYQQRVEGYKQQYEQDLANYERTTTNSANKRTYKKQIEAKFSIAVAANQQSYITILERAAVEEQKKKQKSAAIVRLTPQEPYTPPYWMQSRTIAALSQPNQVSSDRKQSTTATPKAATLTSTYARTFAPVMKTPTVSTSATPATPQKTGIQSTFKRLGQSLSNLWSWRAKSSSTPAVTLDRQALASFLQQKRR